MQRTCLTSLLAKFKLNIIAFVGIISFLISFIPILVFYTDGTVKRDLKKNIIVMVVAACI